MRIDRPRCALVGNDAFNGPAMQRIASRRTLCLQLHHLPLTAL
jgi:hypothetical protein